MLKNQLFGVEVEMTGITREKAAKIVAEVLSTTPVQTAVAMKHALLPTRPPANGKS